MTRKDFLNKVVEVYFRDNCSTAGAIEKAKEELHITKYQFIEWFGKDKDYDYRLRRPVSKA